MASSTEMDEKKARFEEVMVKVAKKVKKEDVRAARVWILHNLDESDYILCVMEQTFRANFAHAKEGVLYVAHDVILRKKSVCDMGWRPFLKDWLAAHVEELVMMGGNYTPNGSDPTLSSSTATEDPANNSKKRARPEALPKRNGGTADITSAHAHTPPHGKRVRRGEAQAKTSINTKSYQRTLKLLSCWESLEVVPGVFMNDLVSVLKSVDVVGVMALKLPMQQDDTFKRKSNGRSRKERRGSDSSSPQRYQEFIHIDKMNGTVCPYYYNDAKQSSLWDVPHKRAVCTPMHSHVFQASISCNSVRRWITPGMNLNYLRWELTEIFQKEQGFLSLDLLHDSTAPFSATPVASVGFASMHAAKWASEKIFSTTTGAQLTLQVM